MFLFNILRRQTRNIFERFLISLLIYSIHSFNFIFSVWGLSYFFCSSSRKLNFFKINFYINAYLWYLCKNLIPNDSNFIDANLNQSYFNEILLCQNQKIRYVYVDFIKNTDFDENCEKVWKKFHYLKKYKLRSRKILEFSINHLYKGNFWRKSIATIHEPWKAFIT